MSPVQTDASLNGADGVPVDVGHVAIRDLVVLADTADGPGVIYGSVSNESDQAEQLRFQLANGATATFRAPAHQALSLSGDSTKTTLATVPSGAGGIVAMRVSAATGGDVTVNVPVVGGQSYYTPTPSAS